MYDLAILGGGPGGYVAALRAAQLGAKVCLVEEARLGGVCLNWGCIPTKALLACADVLDKARHAEDYGLRVAEVGFDWPAIQRRREAVVTRLRGGVEQLLSRRQVEVVFGRGRITGEGELEVELRDGGRRSVQAKAVIVATGSLPAGLPFAPFDGRRILNSDHAVELDHVPQRLLVIGAGVVGCEFAGLYRTFGAQVTMVELLPRILPVEDSRISAALSTVFRKAGIEMRVGAAVEGIEETASGVVATLQGGEEIAADGVLVSIGRVPRSRDIGFEELGIKLERGAVVIDEGMRTCAPWLYAIGDVTGKSLLAHTAMAQGIIAAERILEHSERSIDYRAIPSCIFTRPEIASIGYTEDELKEQGREYWVGQFPLAASGRALALGEEYGFVKVLAAADGSLLGAHIIAAHASEMIPMLALAMQSGLGAEDLVESIQAHPTLAESVVEAAAAVHGEAIHIVQPRRRG